MDIRFYDFDFNHLADFPRTISVNFEKNYCGFGTAEVHFALNETEVITLLEENPYTFFYAGKNSAIVTGYKIDKDIAVFGRTPEWLLTKRGAKAFSVANKTPEVIVRDAITSAAGDFITLGELAGIGTAIDKYKTDKVRVLHDVVCEVLNIQKYGFSLTPDIVTKKFVFDVYFGNELPVTLSKSNRTAYDMTYVVEKQDVATRSGWYERKFEDMGDWDASTNSPGLSDKKSKNAYTYYRVSVAGKWFGITFEKGEYIYSNTPDGQWKWSAVRPENIWLYVDNSEKTGAKKWDVVLSGTKTESEAISEIDKLSQKQTTTSETKALEYGSDYNLGDIVRVQFEFDKFKKAEKKRITSVSIYYDIDGIGVKPTLSSLEE
jgi:hypothetical protein